MGTSSASDGPSPESQLLPDFLSDEDGDNAVIIPSEETLLEPSTYNGDSDEPVTPRRDVIAEAPEHPDLGRARAAYSAFVRDRDRRALRRSVGRYVRDGLGGSKRGAARMTRASAAASRFSEFLTDVRSRGIEAALRTLHLQDLVGKAARDVFAAVIDAVCPSVETIDDAIAREALLDCVLEMNELGIADIADLDDAQMQAFFTSFVTNAALRRFLADVSRRGNSRAISDASYQSLESEIHEFIAASIEAHVNAELRSGVSLAQVISADTMTSLFETAWNILEAADGGEGT